MIFGIGVDIVEHSRIMDIIKSRETNFVTRVLTDYEKKAYQKAIHKDQFLASRFAAKEAFGKALKTGVSAPATFQNIVVMSDENKAPFFEYQSKLSVYLANLAIKSVHLSIAHEQDLSTAFVLIER
tara:strand:- start:82 stop:459 length:378 start_codon:yes stop_codon:yes gene_type:complete